MAEQRFDLTRLTSSRYHDASCSHLTVIAVLFFFLVRICYYLPSAQNDRDFDDCCFRVSGIGKLQMVIVDKS